MFFNQKGGKLQDISYLSPNTQNENSTVIVRHQTYKIHNKKFIETKAESVNLLITKFYRQIIRKSLDQFEHRQIRIYFNTIKALLLLIT